MNAPVDGELESLILYRDPQGGVRAWRNVCPHAGRRLDFAPGKFLRSKSGDLVCAVHGAAFALPEGNCVAGPCRGDCLRAVLGGSIATFMTATIAGVLSHFG